MEIGQRGLPFGLGTTPPFLILLALEFALAADIVRTAVAPTWEDITKLAVIAIVRTMLNYFLAKDISAFDQRGPSEQTA